MREVDGKKRNTNQNKKDRETRKLFLKLIKLCQ